MDRILTYLSLLTPAFSLLTAPQPVSYTHLDEPGYNAENTVAVHIRKIREKIEINPKEPRYLKVVWGVGYKIES